MREWTPPSGTGNLRIKNATPLYFSVVSCLGRETWGGDASFGLQRKSYAYGRLIPLTESPLLQRIGGEALRHLQALALAPVSTEFWLYWGCSTPGPGGGVEGTPARAGIGSEARLNREPAGSGAQPGLRSAGSGASRTGSDVNDVTISRKFEK